MVITRRVYSRKTAKRVAKELVSRGYTDALYALDQIAVDGRVHKDALHASLSKSAVSKLHGLSLLELQGDYYVITNYGVSVAGALHISATLVCERCRLQAPFLNAYVCGDTVKAKCVMCKHDDIVHSLQTENAN